MAPQVPSYPQPGFPLSHYGSHRVVDPEDPPRELSGLAWGVFVSLGVLAVLALGKIVTALHLYSAADEGLAASADLPGRYHAYSSWNGFFGLVFLVSAGVFIAWFYRAYKNLRRLGVQNMRYGDGWAIGAWFIPFFNMVRPKQIANDVWRGSEPAVEVGTQWRQVEVPSLVHWWWALYLVQATLAYIGQEMTSSGYNKLGSLGSFGSGLSEIKSGTVIGVLGAIGAIAAAVVAIRVVHEVTLRLDAIRGEAIAAGPVAPLAPAGAAPAPTGFPTPTPPPPYPQSAPAYPPAPPAPPPYPQPPIVAPPPPVPTMPTEQRIQCPECAEWIQAQANVCRFCGHRLHAAGQ